MNFGRVVRIAIRYKFTFAASIVSSLMVAILWGANIGTIYPVVEVIFQDQTMQQWIDGKITEGRTTIATKSDDFEQLSRELNAAKESGDREVQQDLEWKTGSVEKELTYAK